MDVVGGEEVVVNRSLTVVTNSAMSCYRRCPREYMYSYVLGYRSRIEQEALRIGTLIHQGLELWWKGADMADVLAVADKAADAYEAAKVRVMLRGYDARWSGERDSYVVRAVEAEFRAPLVNPGSGAPSRTFELGGKIDVLLDRGIVEHKTSSADLGLGSVYWQKLALNSQVSTYFAGARALGVEPERCIYDVLRKPGQRPSLVPITDEAGFKVVLDEQGERVYCKTPSKGGPKPRETGDTKLGYVLQTRPETPEEYEERLTADVAADPDRHYQRGEVVRLEKEERDHAEDVWLLTQSMREAERANAFARNTDACERYHGMCSYWPVCSGEASIDDPSRYEKVENVHQELSAAVAAE